MQFLFIVLANVLLPVEISIRDYLSIYLSKY